jgi:cysteinyl-tRNA synthetase
MEVRIFNSLTDRIETFVPLKPREVSIYVCGPTVYSDPISEISDRSSSLMFFGACLFPLATKSLLSAISRTWTIKLLTAPSAKKRAKKKSQTIIYKLFKVAEAVHSLAPDIAPRVTEYIPDIIRYIEVLIDKNALRHRWRRLFPRLIDCQYGELSNINIDDLISGARIEENSKKESPLDFVLWKKTTIGINWESRWSRGRPGWHTECCVMINSLFPDGKIDIHGGGFDLKFPHHENEIAQSKAHNNNSIANYWMHNGFINFGEDKMSKSLGNVILAKDIIEKYNGNLIRLVLLGTYYRSPLTFTFEVMETAKIELEKIENSYRQLAVSLQLANFDLSEEQETDIPQFMEHLANDLNTPNALTELFAIIKKANGALRQSSLDYLVLRKLFSSIGAMLNILGIFVDYPRLSKEDKHMYAEYLKYKNR